MGYECLMVVYLGQDDFRGMVRWIPAGISMSRLEGLDSIALPDFYSRVQRSGSLGCPGYEYANVCAGVFNDEVEEGSLRPRFYRGFV